MTIPYKYLELVGTLQKFGGALFSNNQDLLFEEYDVLDIRWGSSHIMDMNTLEILHPTVEYKIKNSDMKRSRWTRGFAVCEIKIEDE